MTLLEGIGFGWKTNWYIGYTNVLLGLFNNLQKVTVYSSL